MTLDTRKCEDRLIEVVLLGGRREEGGGKREEGQESWSEGKSQRQV